MSDKSPRVAQAQPIRDIHVPSSFQIQAIDKDVEKSLGHDGREQLRKDLDIGEDRSIIHPNLPKFRFAAAPPPPGQQPQKPLPPQTEPEKEEPFPNGAVPGALGLGLERFVGSFQGRGFNTILRPQNGPKSLPLLSPNETLFEINFTHETLDFLDWTVLRDVPNRGFDLFEDVNLRGIPYTQKIRDMGNKTTGTIDDPSAKGTAIHFEQGLFMRTPALIPWKDRSFDKKAPTLVPPSITRMASIPHGTTINIQCLEPETETSGPPVFQDNGKDLNTPIIFPFRFKTPGSGIPFPQMTVDDGKNTNRLPLDIGIFRKNNVINKKQLENPNNFLEENNTKKGKKSFIKHVTFTVDSKPHTKLWGGGTDNFAQLAEQPVVKDGVVIVNNPDDTGTSRANANAVRVSCQYWISTIEDTIKIPVFDKAKLPRKKDGKEIQDKDSNIVWPVVEPPKVDGVDKPSFEIRLDKNDKEFGAKVRYTQIQYSQNVSLDFGILRWPHISVATLVPAVPVPITAAEIQKI